MFQSIFSSAKIEVVGREKNDTLQPDMFNLPVVYTAFLDFSIEDAC